jgi:hypothetical protein
MGGKQCKNRGTYFAYIVKHDNINSVAYTCKKRKWDLYRTVIMGVQSL